MREDIQIDQNLCFALELKFYFCGMRFCEFYAVFSRKITKFKIYVIL